MSLYQENTVPSVLTTAATQAMGATLLHRFLNSVGITGERQFHLFFLNSFFSRSLRASLFGTMVMASTQWLLQTLGFNQRASNQISTLAAVTTASMLDYDQTQTLQRLVSITAAFYGSGFGVFATDKLLDTGELLLTRYRTAQPAAAHMNNLPAPILTLRNRNVTRAC